MSDPTVSFNAGANRTQKTALDIDHGSVLYDRTVVGWPLQPVDMDIKITDADLSSGAIWPPLRFQQRNDRLTMYRDMWRGDFSRFIQDPQTCWLYGGEFQTMTSNASNLLVSTGVPEDIQDLIPTAAVHYLIHGVAYMVCIGGEEYDSPYTEATFEHENGDQLCYATTEVSSKAKTSQPDLLCVIDIMQNDVATKTVYPIQTSNTVTEATRGSWSLGDPIMVETLGESRWSKCLNPPVIGGWGLSALDHLAPMVMALALRLTGQENVLTKHLNPLLFLPGSATDVAKLLGLKDADEWLAMMFEERKDIQDRLMRLNTLWLPNAQQTPSYLDPPSGIMQANMMHIESIKDMIQHASPWLAMMHMQTIMETSGVALQRMLGPGMWQVAQMFERIYAAAKEVYGDFEWIAPWNPEGDPTMSVEGSEVTKGVTGNEYAQTATGTETA